MADEDQFEVFWNALRPNRGVPVELKEPNPKENGRPRTSLLERVIVDRDGVPLISPERAILSQEVHRRVQSIAAHVLNNYIGRITNDTVDRLSYEIGISLAHGAQVAEVANTPEATQEGLGVLLTHAGVMGASFTQSFSNEYRTLTLEFIPQLSNPTPRVEATVDVFGHPLVSITFDLREVQRTAYAFNAD